MRKEIGKRSPTMKDVGNLARVSQTTVSFVINNQSNAGISAETQKRVWEAVATLGYRPNAMARGLRRQRTHTIGFITDEIAITPYAGLIVEGAQDAAWESEKILLLVNTKGDPKIEQTTIEMLLERQVEGIIYATMFHRPVNPPNALREVPTVLLDCYSEDRSFPSVVPQETQGGKAAIQHFIQKGHRRIGFINHPHPIPATKGRLLGYQTALEEGGLVFDAELVIADRSEAKGGYDGTMKLMGLSEPPTAIFCFNDRTAMGAYDALHSLGLHIPGDVAVIGFDNQEIIAASLYPPLTTVELPHYKMGVWAINHLNDLLGGAEFETPIQHQIECPLIERQSV